MYQRRGRSILTLGLALVVSLPMVIGAGSTRAEASASTGALVGLWPGNNGSTADTAAWGFVVPGQYGLPPNGKATYIPDMNRWQGKANTIVNFYDAIDPNAFKAWAPNIWDYDHAIPMMSMNTGNWTYAQVNSGAEDQTIYAFGQAVQAWINGPDVYGLAAPPGGRRLYIRLDWEANDNWYQWSPALNSTDCASLLTAEKQFAQMWQHIYKVTMSAGLTSNQVGWVYSVYAVDYDPNLGIGPGLTNTCTNGAQNISKNMYPGDAYVDWTGIDGYNSCAWTQQTASQIFAPMVSTLRSVSTRPLSIDEVGDGTKNNATACATAAAKGRWIADYMTYIQSAGIRMSLWFNDDISLSADWAVFSQQGPQDLVSTGDCTYTSGLITYNTYCEYAKGLASSYFATPDPTDPRVMSDSEFRGTY
jgi:beta-mannanase